MASPLRPWITTGTGHRRCGTARPPRTPYGASLSFATTTHLWPLPDPPSRKIPAAQPAALGTARSIPGRALASSVSGSPCQGPGTGLPPPISTSVPGTPGSSPGGSPPAPYGLRTLADSRNFFSLVEGMSVAFVHAYTNPRTLPSRRAGWASDGWPCVEQAWASASLATAPRGPRGRRPAWTAGQGHVSSDRSDGGRLLRRGFGRAVGSCLGSRCAMAEAAGYDQGP